MFLRSISMVAVAAVLAAGAPASAQTAAQGALLERALDAATAGDWPEAETLARRTGSKVAADLVTWVRLRDGAGNWDEYQRFLELHADWPGLAAMRRSAERQMPSGQDPEAVFAFFAGEPPQTATGSLRLAEALSTSGREPEAEAEIVRAWRDYSMTGPERQAVMARWKAVLGPHHAARLDMLLWRGLTGEAQAMLPLVDDDQTALARARIAVRRDEAGLQYLINQVPAGRRNDPGLAFERYLYRVDKRRWQEAEDYLREKSTSAEALGPAGPLDGAAGEPGAAGARGRPGRGRLRDRREELRQQRRRLRRLRVGGGLHRADADGRPGEGGRAFRALPGRGGDPDQPRARRLLARPRPRGRRRPRGGARRLRSPAPPTRRASTASSPPPRSGSTPTRR